MLLLSYRCLISAKVLALSRGTMGWSAVCDYGIT